MKTNQKKIVLTDEQLAFVSTLSNRKKNITIKYYNALVELHAILGYTDFVKITQFVKAYKLNKNVIRVLKESKVLINKSIVKSKPKYIWGTKPPSIELAKTIVDELSVISKSVNDKRTSKDSSDISDPLEQELKLIIEDEPKEVKSDSKKEDFVTSTLKPTPADPFELHFKQQERERKQHEKIKELEIQLKQCKANLDNSISTIATQNKIEDELRHQIETLENDNSRLKYMIAKADNKNTNFSFMWGLINYEKIK